MAGTENQCLGVAEALGLTPVVKRVTLRQPWKSLSPWLGFECACTFIPALEPSWPDLLIASGRKSIAASRYIRKMSGGKTLTVQIQDPRTDPSQFDLVAVPAHDPTRGENVIVTTASPNRITAARLERAKTEFPAFADIKTPRVAVLIGGTSKAYKMTRTITETLAEQLRALSTQAGLMITASRRTGAKNEKILREALSNTDAFIWDGSGDNPYFGFLAWADIILVTADSASMLSEAATTGKPVYMIELEGGAPRLNALHRNLMEKKIVRPFEGVLENWSYDAITDAQHVAHEIRKRLEARGIRV
jgi:hypothetical protein